MLANFSLKLLPSYLDEDLIDTAFTERIRIRLERAVRDAIDTETRDETLPRRLTQPALWQLTARPDWPFPAAISPTQTDLTAESRANRHPPARKQTPTQKGKTADDQSG